MSLNTLLPEHTNTLLPILIFLSVVLDAIVLPTPMKVFLPIFVPAPIATPPPIKQFDEILL